MAAPTTPVATSPHGTRPLIRGEKSGWLLRKRVRVAQVAARTRGSVVVPQPVTGGPARFSVLLGYFCVCVVR